MTDRFQITPELTLEEVPEALAQLEEAGEGTIVVDDLLDDPESLGLVLTVSREGATWELFLEGADQLCMTTTSAEQVRHAIELFARADRAFFDLPWAGPRGYDLMVGSGNERRILDLTPETLRESVDTPGGHACVSHSFQETGCELVIQNLGENFSLTEKHFCLDSHDQTSTTTATGFSEVLAAVEAFQAKVDAGSCPV